VVTVAQAGSTNANPSQFLPASTTVTIIITPVAPSAATITKVTPGDGELYIEWTPAANSGGETPVETLTVTGPSGSVVCPVVGHTARCTGLTNLSSYTIMVTTGNSAGSTPSTPATGMPFHEATAPMPLTATGGVRNVTLTWQAPEIVTGGPTALHHFVVEILDGAIWRTAITTSDSATVSGEVTQMPVTNSPLTNATSYVFRAYAVINGGGVGT